MKSKGLYMMNPNLVDERLLSKIKYSLKRPNINTNVQPTDYNNDYCFILLDFIKNNIGIFFIILFLGIVLYLRYQDVKKKKNENSVYNLYKINSI
tara:strand:+ start:476 stop:760 length:285 start_codon:yes stop_codon:yes gene_type:complete